MMLYRFIHHCVKNVRIWSYSRSYFPAFGLNTERYGVSLHIQSECEKIRTRKSPNTDTFHAVTVVKFILNKMNSKWMFFRRFSVLPLSLERSLKLRYCRTVYYLQFGQSETYCKNVSREVH